MILLEKISALGQFENRSCAIKSSRSRNENPGLTVSVIDDFVRWIFHGLHIGDEEEIDQDNPRINHVDAYIGMDDLSAQIESFPEVEAEPQGNIEGLSIPIGRERTGGTKIRWRGPLSRIELTGFDIAIPPLRLLHNENNRQIYMNLDRESSPYPIENGNGRTTRELHFGVEHEFVVRVDNRLRVGRIVLEMTHVAYATILNSMRTAIEYHNA